MNRSLRDPRVRALLALVIVILALALSVHLVGMGVHGMAMMVGMCVVALAAAAALLLPPRPVLRPIALAPVAPIGRNAGGRVEPIGRHPPDEGLRLRR